ncbi:MAG TPA: c-type cytochrome [Micropepsaceae bacterium]|jgi:cytochrome c553|nr:c-type cytochrome [Micropepsaceae bacterium]
MKKLLLASAIALLPAGAFAAESSLSWAYPVAPQGLPQPDPAKTFQPKGAPPDMKLTAAQINNAFGPPDWFPNEHAPMPPIVKNGRQPHVRACMLCHLPNGNGHPESASVSGLTANYIIEQMHEFRDGNRMNNRAPVMIEMAKDITEDELKSAADYFAKVPPAQQKWIRVVEGKTAPKNHVGNGGMRFFDAGGGTVDVAPNMIYEVAEDGEAAEMRDQHFGFVDYVPEGSIKKGEILATTGGNGKTIQCSVCHGADFKGIGDVPRLAGRGAYYLIRQLNDIKTGVRKGNAVALMKPVVEKLSDEDMVNLVAYMASRQP